MERSPSSHVLPALNPQEMAARAQSSSASDPLQLDTSCRLALLLMWRAYVYAETADKPVWQFSMELRLLRAIEIPDASLRLLVTKGLIEHRLEVFGRKKKERVFRPPAGLIFRPASCFAFTPLGIALAERIAFEGDERLDPAHDFTRCDVPYYHGGKRILIFAGLVVKEFMRRAEVQHLILSAFEEENWCRHLADPLPGQAGKDAYRRLNDAIKGLNKDQIHSLLRFHGDGTGTGISWENV